MSRLETAIHNDVKLLRLARDELRLQAHLLKADLKDRWLEMEEKWQRLDEHIGRAQVAADDAGHEVKAAAADLVASIRTGYEQIRSALKQ